MQAGGQISKHDKDQQRNKKGERGGTISLKDSKKHFGYTDEWFESILPPKAIVSSAGNIPELPYYDDLVCILFCTKSQGRV